MPEKRPVTQHELRARPKTKEDEFFERQDKERREEQARKKAAEGSPKRCPADGAVLEEVEHGPHHVDRCPQCGGVWLDPGEPIVKFLRSLAP